jgi:hypothetical protein
MSAKAQSSKIDLPGATIRDEHTSDETGNHIVSVEVDVPNYELAYIIGQFQERGYEVNSIDFNRNQVSFSRSE